jgi:2-dehydro-3-deoxygalactonokinase
MSEAALIGIDWGTSNRRAWLFDRGGAVIAVRRDENGIAKDDAPRFAEGLDLLVKDWPRLPTLMAGMIGSRNGWLEAPYVQCPAGLAEIAARLVPVGDRADLAIVPGLSLAAGLGDVMRGEETQIVGLVGSGPSLAVLPGTHSKWARVTDDRINSFRTFPTGELFAAILDHTVVGMLAESHEVTTDGLTVRSTFSSSPAPAKRATRTLSPVNNEEIKMMTTMMICQLTPMAAFAVNPTRFPTKM